MFWIYDMPTSLLALLTVLVVVVVGIVGLLITRRYLLRPLGFSRDTNDAVNAFSLGITALYSVTVGLIAVASWQNYSAVAGLVSREASTIGVLYRDVAGYPAPVCQSLRTSLREYTVFLVDKVWPAQQQGQRFDEPTAMLTAMQTTLLAYHPTDGGTTVMHAEALRKFDELVDLRRQRVDRVDEGLPAILWVVVGIGAVVTLAVRLFLTVEQVFVHVLLFSLLAVFVGLLVYLIAALDRPFRGRVSVTAEPYRVIIRRVMDPLDAQP